MNLEREARLIAPPQFQLPDLNGVAEDTVAAAPTRQRFEAVYYDTVDLRLARFGVTLHHRTGEDGLKWTLTLAEGAAGRVGRELVFGGRPNKVPTEARDLVRAYTRSQPLKALARLHVDRALVILRDASGRPVADIVDVTASLKDGKRTGGQFREMAVEVHVSGGGGAALLRATVARLVGSGCRADPPVAGVIRALDPRAHAPPDVVISDIRPDATAGQLVRHVVARSVTQMVRHDAGVRLGEHPEDVHQFRVATRRLRSDLRTFGPVLDPKWVSRLRRELAWLGAKVGVVRDTDVLAQRLQAQAQALPEEDAPAVVALLEHLARQDVEARAVMLEALRSPRYDALLDTLVAAAGQPSFASEPRQADRPATQVIAQLVQRPWQRLARDVEALSEDPSDEELHVVRILAKRCRYAAEAAAPVAGRPAARLAAAIAGVQTVLGDHQDATLAEAWLREAATATSDTAIAAGQLIALQRQARTRLRAAWPPTWKAASAPKLRTWLQPPLAM